MADVLPAICELRALEVLRLDGNGPRTTHEVQHNKRRSGHGPVRLSNGNNLIRGHESFNNAKLFNITKFFNITKVCNLLFLRRAINKCCGHFRQHCKGRRRPSCGEACPACFVVVGQSHGVNWR